MKKQMKKEKQTAVIIGVVLLLCLMGAGIFAMTANSAEKKLADQLDLGRKYLDELDYERAIVAYGAAINIDPMNVEAYLGMAEAYEAMGDLDMALQILEQGYEKTTDDTLMKEMERLRQCLKSVGIRPVEGEIVLPYAMDHSVYFSTLQQWKYNPGISISAQEGTEVRAALGGTVIEIYVDDILGQVLVMDLGDGYKVTYGQLQNIRVAVGDSVMTADIIAEVAAPTKYYSLEGCNLYIEVTNNDDPINPEEYFGW